MEINNELVLSGEAAREFIKQMMSVDMAAINDLDAFLSDAHIWIDENGVLNICLYGLNIDLSVLDNQ